MIKVSVILVAYNAEEFVENSLFHLQEQIYKNIEVVMIDDGSIDNTSLIMKDYSLRDKRFKYYYKINGGVSSARNLGVLNASGHFIIHHDVDDYMPKNAINDLVKEQQSSNAKIIIADYNLVINNSLNIIPQFFNGNYYDLIDGLLNNRYHGALWNKLIAKELYYDLSFEETINYMEDKLMIIQMLVKHKPSISYVNAVVYNYVQHKNSITNILSDRSLDNVKNVIIQIEDLLIKNNIQLNLEYLKFNYKLKAILNNKQIRYKDDFKEINSKIFKLKNIKFIHKIMVWCKVNKVDFIPNLIIKYR